MFLYEKLEKMAIFGFRHYKNFEKSLIRIKIKKWRQKGPKIKTFHAVSMTFYTKGGLGDGFQYHKSLIMKGRIPHNFISNIRG